MDQVVYFASTSSESPPQASEAALAHAARQLSPLMARGVGFESVNNVPRLLARLQRGGVDALIIDARQEDPLVERSPAVEVIQSLFHKHEIGGPVGREQTWLLVNPDHRGALLSFEAGRARLAGCLAVDATKDAWGAIWQQIETTLRRRKGGRIALCLAGGGIEGLYYELGVLRALQYFMPEFAMHQVDIICGISAGAIIGAMLANGLSTEEIIQGMQFGRGKLDRIDRFSILDPNVSELLQRLGYSARSILRRRSTPLQSLFRLAPNGIFAGNGLRTYLAQQFAKPGMTDDFRELKRKLFIGATDQDTAEHVVFGTPEWDHIPIHRAVRASSALTPFFAPEQLEGRYFVDGTFTRTTNVRIAVENEATLVLLIDPLVPVCSERPGSVVSKGGLMVGMQGLKSLIHGRFDRAVRMLRTMYPHVAFHLFQPDNATMRVMAGSPMKLLYRPEIEEIAFRETLRSIRQHRLDNLERDFGRHSVPFVDPQADLSAIRRDLFDDTSDVQVA